MLKSTALGAVSLSFALDGVIESFDWRAGTPLEEFAELLAGARGIDLTLADQLIVVLTATLASVGAAGVPSAGIITLIIVLISVGMAEHVQAGIALILGVDRILDMLRTSVNVTGDLTCSAFIARTEGETLMPELAARGAD